MHDCNNEDLITYNIMLNNLILYQKLLGGMGFPELIFPNEDMPLELRDKAHSPISY
jgi:hypothetical protein